MGYSREIPGLSSPDVAPVRLSIPEYETSWKPYGWEILHGSTRETYREDEWGVWEAIRDIVQNALDETEGYAYSRDADGFLITDRGGGVAVRDFLYGEAKDKKKPEWARGRFGEGMKLACLVMLRKGYPVRIRTVNREIWPVLYPTKVGPKEYEDTLQFLWRQYSYRGGTEFKIFGYTGPAYEKLFAVNLPKSDVLAQVPSPVTRPKQRYNTLLRTTEPPPSPLTSGWAPQEGGVIYCRDIYLRSIKSPFSYNLWGFPLAPDRHGPMDEDDLKVDMGRLWCGVASEALIKMFLPLVKRIRNTNTVESSIKMIASRMGKNPVTGENYFHLVERNSTSWQRAWKAVFGPHTVLKTGYGRYDNWVTHLNYESIELEYDVTDVLSEVIKTDAKLVAESQDRLRDTDVLGDNKLPANVLAHLKIARKIASGFGVMQVNAAIIPPASDNARTAGIYNSELQSIKIHLNQLESLINTLDTIIHEVAHHTAFKSTFDFAHPQGDITLAEDLTSLHADQMTRVAAVVIKATSEGAYDTELKAANL